jgi:hypothetical protein
MKKRFSTRFGFEKQPEIPVTDAAPPRFIHFVFETLRNDSIVLNSAKIFADVYGVSNFSGYVVTSEGWNTILKRMKDSDWWLVFNLVEPIYENFATYPHAQEGFAKALNETFAQESMGWRFEKGELVRTLPGPAQEQLDALFRELSQSRFRAALESLITANKAFNAVQRRDSEVCEKAFDACESVAKEVFFPDCPTFGDCIKEMRKQNAFASLTLAILEKLYALASAEFRHGNTAPFKLSAAEAEFVYLTCIAAMLMFVHYVPKTGSV